METTARPFVPPFCPRTDCPHHRCPAGWRWKRAGTYARQCEPRTIQRYRCAHCGVTFSSQTFSTTYYMKRPELLELQTKLRFDSAGYRQSGSAALDLAYVAAGYLDGFVGAGLKEWDLAAGTLLIKEAGGLITDLNGEGEYMMSGDIVAATPKLLPALLREINPAANTAI